MSLYFEAASVISDCKQQSVSLKSRLFNTRDLKCPPAQLYAVISEAVKWSSILKEVIERSQLLVYEKKLSPALALLLVHDQCLAKKGIAAPATHSLRLAIERHKARLHAEFTKARIRRGCASLEALRHYVKNAKESHMTSVKNANVELDSDAGETGNQWPHPRWIRINTLRTSLKEQLATTFVDYQRVNSVQDVMSAKPNNRPALHVDVHVPDLIALPLATDLSSLSGYRKGFLIAQDKASCFPAYLLDPQPEYQGIVDACAAPGNKVTHLAALLNLRSHRTLKPPRIWACERDQPRAKTLQTMIDIAGADALITVKLGQDFLRLNPKEHPWCTVGALLLDPSCSGSGIIGRDDEMLIISLPSKETSTDEIAKKSSKKRKRTSASSSAPSHFPSTDVPPFPSPSILQTRLSSLSSFQTKLLLHASRFPCARKITYSTCSIYSEENEAVVLSVLTSPEVKEAGWRIMYREEQVAGMRAWPIRGDLGACEGDERVADALIRCEKGTREGTQGFFVAGFVRTVPGNGRTQVDGQADEPKGELGSAGEGEEEVEWEGFDDDG